MGRRILVCGSRGPISGELHDFVWSTLSTRLKPGDVVIHGAASGVDEQAMLFADKTPDVEHLPFQADWTQHGRSAGPIRNRRMLEEGRPDFVIAFTGGRGTGNMVKQALAASVKVVDLRGKERLSGGPGRWVKV